MRSGKFLHCLIAVSGFMLAGGVAASEGGLDTTFAGTGTTTIPIVSGTTPTGNAQSVSVDASGKIVLAGGASVPAASGTMGMVRLLSDGTPDATFGNLSGQPGRSAFDLTPTFTYLSFAGFATKMGAGAQAYYLGATSYISPNYAALVLRVNDAGQLDSTFGTSGYAVVDLSGGGNAHSLFARAVAALADGSVVIGGEDYNAVPTTTVYFAHVLANGTQDSNFGTNGVLYVPTPANAQHITIVDMKTDTNGNIIVALDYDVLASGIHRMALIHLSSTGVLDTAFAGNATFAVVDFGLGGNGGDTPGHVAVESDGKYVIAGGTSSATAPTVRCGVARFNNDGTPDTTFASVGYQSFGSYPCNDIAVQSSHRLIAIGGETSTTGFALRINANGTLDTSFGSAGVVTIANVGALSAVALDSAQRTVAAGTAVSNQGMYAARLSTDDLFVSDFETQ